MLLTKVNTLFSSQASIVNGCSPDRDNEFELMSIDMIINGKVRQRQYIYFFLPCSLQRTCFSYFFVIMANLYDLCITLSVWEVSTLLKGHLSYGQQL